MGAAAGRLPEAATRTKVGIDSEELDQTVERGTELTEAKENRRLELVIVEVAALRGGICSLAMGAAEPYGSRPARTRSAIATIRPAA